MPSWDEHEPTIQAPPAVARSEQANAPFRETLALSDGQRYRSRSLLGEGGMGEVWLFDDQRVGRSVAFKQLRGGLTAAENAQHRFVREARIQAMIEHPAVVPVYDVGVREDGSLYFTMRRVNGRTLKEILQRLARGDLEEAAKWSRRKLLTAFVQVCQAIHFAHRRGVIHRDIKPSNVMLGAFGEVYVLDWGIAKILADSTDVSDAAPASTDARAIPLGATPESGPALTHAGAVLGTPGYIAPELLDGTDSASPCTDVYALGATLFELLTLRNLHPGEEMSSVLRSNIEAKPSSAQMIAPDVPPELDELCARATRRDPAVRIASADELASAVERYLDGDRDQERRRNQAQEQAELASAATQRALASGTTPTDAQSARTEATRAVLQALALDPQQSTARELLLRLLVEVPAVVPREVEDDIVAAREKVRVEGTKQARWALLLWVAGTPFCMLIGVRWKALVIAGVALNLLAFFVSELMQRRRSTGFWGTAALGLGFYGTIATFSTWLGPFVFVPTAAAITTLIFILNATERERPWFIGLGVLSSVAPLLGQWTGVLPRQFEFRPDGVLLRPGVLELPEGPTMTALLLISLGYCSLPALFVAKLNGALAAAQRQLFLQAWQLRHSLLAPPPGKPISAPVSGVFSDLSQAPTLEAPAGPPPPARDKGGG